MWIGGRDHGRSRERCGHTIPISPRLRMRPRGSIRSIWRELIGLTRCEHHSSGCQPTPGGDRVRRVLIAPTAFRNFVQLIPSSFAAVPPKIAIQSSLNPGVDGATHPGSIRRPRELAWRRAWRQAVPVELYHRDHHRGSVGMAGESAHFGLRERPPTPAVRAFELPPRMQPMLDRAKTGLAEPFRGIITDGGSSRDSSRSRRPGSRSYRCWRPRGPSSLR